MMLRILRWPSIAVLVCAAASVGTAALAQTPVWQRNQGMLWAPMLQTTPSNWTGPYVGIVFGGEWHNTDVQVDDARGGVNARSPYLGFQAGYNYQPVGSNFLVGVQGSVGFIDINNTSQIGGFDVNVKSRNEGSALVRGGFFVAPQTLLFVSTGAAFLGQEVRLSTPAAQFGSDSTTRVGFEVVVGLERAITANLHARLCGVYADFGTHTFSGNIPVNTTVSAVRLSLSWAFGH
jgi:outer membrane immunogenic protein